MSQTVSVPGVGDLDFPDGMSQADMASAIQKNFPDIHKTDKEARKQAVATRSPAPAPKSAPNGIGSDQGVMADIGTKLHEDLASGASDIKEGGLKGVIPGIAENVLGMITAGNRPPETPSGRGIAKMLSAPIEAGSKVIGQITGEAGRSMAESAGATPETQGQVEAAGSSIGEVALPIAMATQGLRGAPKAEQIPAKTYSEALAADRPMPGSDKGYSPLREFTPEQEARYGDLKKHKPTLGQVTRDPQQIIYERHESARSGGEPKVQAARDDLEQQLSDQNKSLADALRKSGPRKNEPIRDETLGELIRGSTNAKYLAKRAEVRKKYDAADASPEGDVPVDVSPIKDYFKANRTEEINNPALKSLRSKFEEILPKAKTEEATGGAGAIGGKFRTAVVHAEEAPSAIQLRTLNELYKAAGRVGKPIDPPSMRVANEVKALVKKLEDQYGGSLYKGARESRKQLGTEFEEQGGVARILKKESRTDMKVDASDLPDKIIYGKPEDLQQTLATLTRDIAKGDKSTRRADVATLRGLRQKGMQDLVEKATGGDAKATDAKGNRQFSPDGLERGLERMGRQNVELLYGKENAEAMYKLVKTAADLKTAPKALGGSPTTTYAQAVLDKQFTNRAAYVLEQVAHKLNIPMVPGAIRLLREKTNAAVDEAAKADMLRESTVPTRASPETIDAMAKSAKKEGKQIRMDDALKRAKIPAATILMSPEDSK